jgi:NAD(P)-dependent dehydrogenase (short-subunit alcohol dehydrogenase family)
VAVHFRGSRQEAHETVGLVREAGGRASCFQADLGIESEAEGLLPRAADALGPVTLLVNNASVFEEDHVGAITRESWALHLDANLRAPVLLAQAFAGQAEAGGLIVNLLDQRVLKPNPQFFSYTVSKAALWAATRTLAQALAPRVRVNGIGPGPTLGFRASGRRGSSRPKPGHVAGAPRGAGGDRRRPALSDQRAVVTGQMIAVDGGQHLGWRTPDVVGA